jgi:hypothetical protein
MGRTESLNLKNDYERARGWYGHFNKSEMALFSECTDRYAQKLLDTADIVREAILHQLTLTSEYPKDPGSLPYTPTVHNEHALMAAFLKRSKRGRYWEIPSNPLLRHKFTNQFGHFTDFDPKYHLLIPSLKRKLRLRRSVL